MIIASIYAACLILITFFGVHAPSDSIEWLVGASNNLDIMRITLGALILAGAFIPAEARIKEILFGAISVSLGMLLVGNFLMGEFFRQIGLQFYTLDMIALVEGMIVAALLKTRASEEKEEIFDMFSGQSTSNSPTA